MKTRRNGMDHEDMKENGQASDKLDELVSMPVCPYCKATMEPENFEGYYDSFACWVCDCEKLPDAPKTYGNYAC